MKISDEKLAADFLGGDEKAFEELVDRYLKPLYNFAFQLTQDQSASQDIVQDVFVKVWKNLARFDGKRKFSTWIFAIAKNTVYDLLKKKKVLPFSAFENAEGENFLESLENKSILSNAEILQKLDNAKEAQQLLDSLSPQLKTILLLHFQQGFSLAEIAEIFGQSSNTVKSQYRRAIFSLRKINFSKKFKNKVAPKPFSGS